MVSTRRQSDAYGWTFGELLDRWDDSPAQRPELETAIWRAYRELGGRVRRREIGKDQAAALTQKYAAFNNTVFQRQKGGMK